MRWGIRFFKNLENKTSIFFNCIIYKNPSMYIILSRNNDQNEISMPIINFDSTEYNTLDNNICKNLKIPKFDFDCMPFVYYDKFNATRQLFYHSLCYINLDHHNDEDSLIDMNVWNNGQGRRSIFRPDFEFISDEETKILTDFTTQFQDIFARSNQITDSYREIEDSETNQKLYFVRMHGRKDDFMRLNIDLSSVDIPNCNSPMLTWLLQCAYRHYSVLLKHEILLESNLPKN